MPLTRKLSLWLPVLIQVGIIFYFSSQPAGSPSLERFPVPSVPGHFLGYFLLGGLLYRAFAGGLAGWNASAARLALVASVVHGIADELNQFFVPGRTASAFDVLVDGLGALAAVAAVRGSLYLRERREKRRV